MGADSAELGDTTVTVRRFEVSPQIILDDFIDILLLEWEQDAGPLRVIRRASAVGRLGEIVQLTVCLERSGEEEALSFARRGTYVVVVSAHKTVLLNVGRARSAPSL